MKSYVKPDASLVDLRLEERLAANECYEESQTADRVEFITPDARTSGCKASLFYDNLLIS